MTAANSDVRRSRAVGPLLLAGYAAAAAAVAGYALTFPAPAPSTAAAQALGSFTAALTGAVCLGGLVLILITARPNDRGVIDPAALQAHRVVERMSVVWLVTAKEEQTAATDSAKRLALAKGAPMKAPIDLTEPPASAPDPWGWGDGGSRAGESNHDLRPVNLLEGLRLSAYLR